MPVYSVLTLYNHQNIAATAEFSVQCVAAGVGSVESKARERHAGSRPGMQLQLQGFLRHVLVLGRSRPEALLRVTWDIPRETVTVPLEPMQARFRPSNCW